MSITTAILVSNAYMYTGTPLVYTGLADTTAWTAESIYLKFAKASVPLTIAVF